MPNTIRIKRSTTTATPAALEQGELAYSESGGTGEGELFIGVAGPGIEKVGGYKDVQKLAGIDANANNYVHPNDGVDLGAPLTGANVISDVDVNAAGHVTGFATRALTPGDIGAATSGHTHTTYDYSAAGLTGANVFSDLEVVDGIVTDVATRALTLGDLGFTGDSDANNYSHPNHTGDVTSVGDGATTIANDAVTYAKMQNVANDQRILGNVAGANQIVTELTKAQVLTMINVEDGADVTDATNVDAAGATMNTDTDVSSNSWVIDEDTMASDLATKVPTQQSVKAYVDSVVIGGMVYRGAYNASTNTPDLDTSPSGVVTGDTYTVTVAGTFFTTAVEVGDVLIAEANDATTEAEWTIVNRNIDQASQTVAGIVELATSAETNTGTDATRAVTPDGLDDWEGSTQVTTLGTIGTGTWQGTAIGETYLPSASESAKGIIEIATQGEVDAATDTVRAVVPSYLHATTFDGGTF